MFIDGIGIGKNDPDTNPFARYAGSFLSLLAEKSPARPLPVGLTARETDAAMGIKGLPQSATGQTSLWTGVNGPILMGRHLNAFPGPTLRKVIQEYSIIKCLTEAGKKATLLNAYNDAYLKRLEKKPRFASTSTLLQRASGKPLLSFEDLKANRAMYMDITHHLMHQFYPESDKEFPLMDPFERGRDIVKMSREYDLAIYEYFLTDKVGHAQDFMQAETLISHLERFFEGIAAELNQETELLIITSDHGNMEDLSRKTHTSNPVITYALGKGSEQINERVRALYDIPPVIYDLLGVAFPVPENERPEPHLSGV
ncbi:MAG: metalloenzyme [Spirochaetia bacterium]|nr:metalloenzyme [Spirochaetia bacterium]